MQKLFLLGIVSAMQRRRWELEAVRQELAECRNQAVRDKKEAAQRALEQDLLIEELKRENNARKEQMAAQLATAKQPFSKCPPTPTRPPKGAASKAADTKSAAQRPTTRPTPWPNSGGPTNGNPTTPSPAPADPDTDSNSALISHFFSGQQGHHATAAGPEGRLGASAAILPADQPRHGATTDARQPVYPLESESDSEADQGEEIESVIEMECYEIHFNGVLYLLDDATGKVYAGDGNNAFVGKLRQNGEAIEIDIDFDATDSDVE